jgi:hypothetical protein
MDLCFLQAEQEVASIAAAVVQLQGRVAQLKAQLEQAEWRCRLGDLLAQQLPQLEGWSSLKVHLRVFGAAVRAEPGLEKHLDCKYVALQIMTRCHKAS